MKLHDPGKLIKTLRLTPQEQAEVLDSLGKENPASAGALNRRSVRVPYRVGAVIVMLTHPGQATVKYSVVPRNLSARGLAFIHGQFVHAQSECRVVLPDLAGRWVAIDGRVARCRHVRGLIHEVSVVFGEMVELAQFVDLSPGEKARAQPSDAPANTPARDGGEPPNPSPVEAARAAAAAAVPLHGRVLVVDDFAGDRRLFAFWLSKRGAVVIEAGDGAAAHRALQDHGPIDLILVDMHLGTESGLGVVRRLRDHGFVGPVIALSADNADEAQATALAAGSNAFLPKPCDRERFLEAAEQLLRLDLGDSFTERSPLRSTLAGDADMAPLLREFAGGLDATIRDLKRAQAGNDAAAMRTLCQQLKGSGTSYGFEPITRAARLAMARLQAAPQDGPALRQAVAELIATLQRVRVERPCRV